MKRTDAAQRWEELCPPLYRESDTARLPAAALAAVADYRYGALGLGFVGVSGLGKTRAMMLLCHRLIVEEGRHGEYVHRHCLLARSRRARA